MLTAVTCALLSGLLLARGAEANPGDPCGPGFVECNDFLCVQERYWCNGPRDCPNWEDEENCPNPVPCPLDHVPCHDFGCVNLHGLCDGSPECRDGSDEWNCTADAGICERYSEGNKFACSNGRCKHITFQCDGSNDCGDFSDEVDCFQKKSDHDCRYDFRCGSGACVFGFKRCNGEVDCEEDGKDEEGCPPADDTT